jgi:hypothetical protein
MHSVRSLQILESVTFLIRYYFGDTVQSKHISITYTGDKMSVVVLGTDGNEKIIAESDDVPIHQREFRYVFPRLRSNVAAEVREVLHRLR